MFSYLRTHKRGNTSSASAESTNAHTQANPPINAHNLETFLSPSAYDSQNPSSRSPVAALPPILPPIPRVASQYGPKVQKEQEHRERNDERQFSTHEQEQHRISRPTRAASAEETKEDCHSQDTNSLSTSSSRDTFYCSSDEQRKRNEGWSNERVMKPIPRPRTSSTEAFAAVNSSRQRINLGNSSAAGRPTSSKETAVSASVASGRPGKTRLHLKNPMSLLMRRRFGHSADSTAEPQSLANRNGVPAMSFPDDYDPRIKGKGVHDFSAPRSRRIIISDQGQPSSRPGTREAQCQPDSNAKQTKDDHSPTKLDKPYTPIFRENFDEEISQGNERGVRAETLANQKFLSRVSHPQPDHPPPPPPKLGSQGVPIPLPKGAAPQPGEKARDKAQQEIVDQTIPEEYEEANVVVESSKSRKSSRAARSRAASNTDGTFQPSGLPAHMSSKASRFSFQIGESDSAAQEKLLEERHKAKAAAKAQSSAPKAQNVDEDEYDEDMYDPDYDGYDGLEEDVPLTGVDDYDNAGLGFSSLMETGSNMNATYGPFGEPLSPINSIRDQPLSATITETDTVDLDDQSLLQSINGDISANLHSSELGGLYPLSKLDTIEPLTYNAEPHNHLTASNDTKSGEEDDLYFDDGLIEGPPDGEGQIFDEKVFDDPSHPLYERNAPRKVSVSREGVPSGRELEESRNEKASSHVELNDCLSGETPEQQSSSKANDQVLRPDEALGNIEAYYSALAEAANKAAADGRFKRTDSIDSTMAAWENLDVGTSKVVKPDLEQRDDTLTAWAPDDDDVNFDESIDDYDIIAAANAEALANDYDGEYGQEFGFYASAQGGDGLMNGGYFGPRGINSLGRSMSGRNAVREPNLTPITERSEYSTRNSFISMHYNSGSSSHAVTSPALAQLAQMSQFGFPEDDPEISMVQLMKLRRDAFGGGGGSAGGGGSNASSPRNSSPTASMLFGRGISPMAGPGMSAWDMAVGEASASDGSPILLEEANEEDEEEEEFDNEAIAAANEYDSDDQNDDTIAAGDWSNGRAHDASRSESPTVTALDGPFQAEAARGYATRAEQTAQVSRDVDGTEEATRTSSSRASHLSSDPSVSPAHGHSTASTLSPVFGPDAPSKDAQGPPVPPFSAPSGRVSHSRNGSTADSVTYVKEQDEGGGERWVLERRRTAETGELELVGREIVEGGRI